MRKVVLGLGISLDGYIARRDGAVDFLFINRQMFGFAGCSKADRD